MYQKSCMYVLLRMGLFGADHRLGEGACNDEIWHSYTLPKEDSKST